MRRIGWAIAMLGTLLLLPRFAAGDVLVLHLDPEASSLDFTLDATLHKVDGHLGPASGDIRFDPASEQASGEVVIDLTASDTGIARRDRKMQEQVLKTDRFPHAVFRVSRIDFLGPLQQGGNDLQLHGQLDLAGTAHDVSVLAHADLDGDHVTASAWLDVPYVDWGLHDPSFFVLRVAKVVRVTMTIEGRLEGEMPVAKPAAK